MLVMKDGNVKLKSAGEAMSLMICSIMWPMIDTYFATLIFSMTLVKQRNELDTNFSKDVQWMAETLFIEKKTVFYEACNQPSIGNAKSALMGMNVLAKNGPSYITLH